MHFKDLNWMQIDNYLKQDDRAMLVLGSCEQHGYLSLMTDANMPMALAEKAAEQSGVLVAPPLNFGCSPFFLDYPGTISLRLQTFLVVVEDILRSLYEAGFRRVLILNGHSGNTPVQTHLVELVNQLTDLKLRWYAWWTTVTVAQIAKQYQLDTEHGSWMEAFDFNIVTPLPENTKPVPDTGEAILGAAETRNIYGDGTFGGAYQVEPAIMQEIFNACLADLLDLLKFD